MFLEVLNKWNKSYNLTAISDIDEVIYKHIIDSLIISKNIDFSNYNSVIDVGTGAGFPGIPLSILYSNVNFYLLDGLQKRISFLNHIKITLQLKNIFPVKSRAEDFKDKTFDLVISRGTFSSIGDCLKKAGHLCKPGGYIVLMKGEFDESFKKEIIEGFVFDKVEHTKIAETDWKRCLVYIKKQ